MEEESELGSQARVYTMPEKFRAGGASGDKQPAGGSRRLVKILIAVVVVAGLGIGGLYAFQNVFNQPANDNLNVIVNRNQNTNGNLNAVTNLNANANQNANSANADSETNGNLNSNQNANSANANVTNANSGTNSNTNTSPASTPLPSSADSDADGLTDVEEVVYGTDASKPDTDGDGYIDGKRVQGSTILGELYLGYNPKGDGSLEGSSLVKRVNNNANAFSALIPNSWTAVLDAGGGIMITPASATGEFFQVRTNANETRQSPEDWYQTVSPGADTNSLKVDAFTGFRVLWSQDQSTAYLFRDTVVYSIQYSTGSLTQVNYWTTFDMIVRSFKLVAS